MLYGRTLALAAPAAASPPATSVRDEKHAANLVSALALSKALEHPEQVSGDVAPRSGDNLSTSGDAVTSDAET